MSQGRAVHVLYMEDDSGLARLLQKSLQRQGYTVDIADNGREGLAMVEQTPYDIVLVDYNMPMCGGIDVLRSVAEMESFPPVIMVTGNGNEKIAVEALKLGATDYVVKDVEMGYLELLPMVINQVMQKQQLIREREQMHEAVRESEERYRKLVELSPDGIAIHMEGRFVFMNPAGTEILGAAGSEELIGRTLLDFVHPDYRQIVVERLHRLEQQQVDVPLMEQKFFRLDGKEIDVEVSSLPFTFNGKPAVQSIFRDITERNLARQRLEQMANFDSLTGLPNRSLFFDRLRRVLAHAKRYNDMFALLFLDLDRFKEVNDSFGHDVGDMLLQEVATRLKGCLRESDSVARMGGDEFTIILSRIADGPDAAVVARKIIGMLNEPFRLRGHECFVGVSIGIGVFPVDASDTETLLKKADSAMYLAKEGGRNGYRLWGEDSASAA